MGSGLVVAAKAAEVSMATTLRSPASGKTEEQLVAEQLKIVESRLIERYANQPEITPDRVRQTFAAVADRFEDARIRAFVPILVERAVRREIES
jgi:hypothetical protein